MNDMDAWLANPLTYILALAVVGALAKAFMWVGAVNSDRQHWRRTIDEIATDIKAILTRLPPVTTTSGSPTALTDLGETISRKINARELARTLAVELVSEVKGKNPYEVEEFCFKYVKDFEPTDEQRNLVQSVAYENGLDTEDVFDVLAVELRDELLGHPSS